ncbi:DUF2637 domain-containing protein [Longispora albida]|uniref:DUF2637 domain-containing protein n=1 Tax=Longispora albida TaxID=203523 RepID=UPI00068849AD|nr:DUF2637 domain-containing protein [Longispora albida]
MNAGTRPPGDGSPPAPARGVRIAATATVAVLAGVAAAISYDHMRTLAVAHGESGWRSHAFPVSVDGIEVVASLVLFADKRAGRISGWLPWAALAAGTAASMAANVAVGGHGLVGKVVAGWPALALLIAVKLLTGILDPQPASSQEAGPSPAPPEQARPGTPPPGEGGRELELLPAARVAAARLRARGAPLTRDSLVAQMRTDGHTVRNARASALLAVLRGEETGVR